MTDIELISARLHSLERKFRILKLGVVIASLVVGSLGLMGQAGLPGDVLPSGRARIESAAPQSQSQFEVRAQRFVLVDDSGKERASLVTDGNGSVYLVMFDAQGKNRINLSVNSSGPSLALYDPSGQARAIIGSTPLIGSRIAGERTPASSVVLFDKDGRLLSRQ